MLEQYLAAKALRGVMVAACLTVVAGCGNEVATVVEAPATAVPVAQAPAAPAGLTAAAGNAQVGLTWSTASSATSYRIKRAMTGNGPYTQLASVSAPGYSDGAVTNGTTFFYVVTAVNDAGEGAASAPASATPAAPAPTVLTVPTAISAMAANGQVALSWSATSGATSYHVKRSTTNGGPYTQVAAPTAASFTDTSLSNGTTFYYVVSAVYSSGESGNSMQVNATPMAPVVSGNCGSLAAPGQWQEISPASMTKAPPYTGALYTLVDTNNSGTVYVTTSGSGIFKSVDCGASWTKTNTGRNGDQIDKGLVWSAVLDPVDSKTIYALTGYGPNGLWKSIDSGVNWDNVMPATLTNSLGVPGFVARVSMDPTDHLHLLVAFHDNCTNGHTPVCFGESKDGGKTWAILDFPTSLKNGWGEGTFILPIDSTHWLYEYWELYYTADAGKTWKQVDTGGAAAIQGPYYKDPTGSLWLASIQGILTSRDGEHWTRIPNSFGGMDAITGCGSSLYAAAGFQPPTGSEYIYTATMASSTAWSVLQTPGLPTKMVAGANAITCDTTHNLVYVSAQAGGLWRMVAR